MPLLVHLTVLEVIRLSWIVKCQIERSVEYIIPNRCSTAALAIFRLSDNKPITDWALPAQIKKVLPFVYL